MDDQTRTKFKQMIDDMISDATKNEETARDIQRQAMEKRSQLEMLSASGSSSRSRRKKGNAAAIDDQVTELEKTAADILEIVQNLWNKIHEMQEAESRP